MHPFGCYVAICSAQILTLMSASTEKECGPCGYMELSAVLYSLCDWDVCFSTSLVFPIRDGCFPL